MRQTTGGDAFFLYTDRESRHQHISMLNIYDQSSVRGGPLRFKTILEQVEKRLGASPIFRQKLVQVPLNLDYPYWINDPDFDLEFHVRHIALPKPGDWRQLCIQVSRLHSRPLDMSRPVWEMYVIEGLDNVDFLPGGAFAIMTKVHHVALDGVAAAELTMAIHDTEPYPDKERRQRRWRAERPPRSSELLGRAGINNLRRGLRTGLTLTGKLGGAARAMASSSKEPVSAEQGKAPVTRFNQPISPHRVWDAARFDLEEFRAVKTAVPGATINDVVLTVCGGAMIRYLDSKHETPDLPLTAMVPVSVRSKDESGGAGNKIHLSRTSLGTLERDPLKRLALVRKNMEALKRANAVSARELMEIQEQIPAPTLMLAGRAVAASRGPGRSYRASHNMVVTNVPGPQQPLYFCGARLVMFTGMAVIGDNMGISHAVTSYDGDLVIAPLSDRKMMPDPAFYRECLEAAFAELREAAVGKLASKPGKPKKKSAPAKKRGKRATSRGGAKT
ncbi:wax ester/triacylglycerol synthase family O-acyltransferase [Seongchinamella sediminis]|uniref:diacylglycerol O-acyltransferase n=1 Tax=Seongchinamella sediminis TaxID=2283635 RepID=A0A3L7DYJ3_9GAMM|nr:wax ester/triacylglycerol synthase family O-acyltransferase [Seongchinamella sediminis]RLQ22276.1 wax ester/triacylglycerol synthase family O-acyltransferase [Seongchinamella sediminis]